MGNQHLWVVQIQTPVRSFAQINYAFHHVIHESKLCNSAIRAGIGDLLPFWVFALPVEPATLVGECFKSIETRVLLLLLFLLAVCHRSFFLRSSILFLSSFPDSFLLSSLPFFLPCFLPSFLVSFAFCPSVCLSFLLVFIPLTTLDDFGSFVLE